MILDVFYAEPSPSLPCELVADTLADGAVIESLHPYVQDEPAIMIEVAERVIDPARNQGQRESLHCSHHPLLLLPSQVVIDRAPDELGDGQPRLAREGAKGLALRQLQVHVGNLHCAHAHNIGIAGPAVKRNLHALP